MFSEKSVTTTQGIIVVVIIIIAVGAGAFLVFRGPEKETIKIGVVGPMEWVHGKNHKWGAQMAIEEINAQGGVLGKPLELVVADGEADPTVSATAAERLITKHDIKLLTGGFRSEAVSAMQEVACDHEVVFMSSGSISPETTQWVGQNYEDRKYFFRGSPVNAYHQAAFFLYLLKLGKNVVREELGIEKPRVAVLGEMVKGYTPMVHAAEGIIQADENMIYIGTWRPGSRETDVSSYFADMEAEEVDIIWELTSGPVGIAVSNEYGARQTPALLVGSNVEGQKPGFWDATNGMCEYEVIGQFLGPHELTPWVKPFYEEFEEKFGETPIYVSATYDIVHWWANAVERAGTFDSDAVVMELERRGENTYKKQAFRDMPQGCSVYGYNRWDENHDLVGDPAEPLVSYVDTYMGRIRWEGGVGNQWQDGGEITVTDLVPYPANENLSMLAPNEFFKIPPWMMS